MRRVVGIVVGVVLGFGTAWAEVLDALAARIDGDVITWSQVTQEAAIRRLSGEPEALQEPEVVRQALVRRRLLVAEAEKLRLEVDPTEIESAVVELVAASGGEGFWAQLATLGLSRGDVDERARELLLVRRYLDLRREMTFVPESEIKAYYFQHLDRFRDRPLAGVRDELRASLAERAYQDELDKWIDRQTLEGRVESIELPEPTPR